jgi:cobalt/nickel transport system ATP-binding protein
MTTPASSRASSPAFALAGVSFAYPGTSRVCCDVSFSIATGERVAILGANGSGKSTLLMLMDALAFPTAGTIEVLGQPATEASLRDPAFNRAFRSRVGFVFQDSDAQLFSATVRDEIAFAPLQLGLTDAEVASRVDGLLADLGLEKLADRAPFTLSGGEKKRAAIGAVLAADPSILLLDEPTNGLDPRTQVWLLELIERWESEGRTVVMATHDLGFAEEATRRAIILSEDHTVVADGPVADVLSDRELLLRVNLIHEHAHRHGLTTHVHAHAHGPAHAHEHPR